MILRRVIAHFKKQEWTAIALDFLIVVVGVFVGLQVNNWNEARADARLGAEYTVRLASELRKDLAAAHTLLGYYDQVLVSIVEADRLLSESDADPLALVIAAYRASEFNNNPPNSATWDEIVSAGQIGLLPDATVEGGLAEYYKYQDANDAINIRLVDSPYRLIVRSLIPLPVQLVIREGCSDVLDDINVASGFVAECRIDIDPALINETADALRASSPLRETLRHQYSMVASVQINNHGNVTLLERSIAALNGTEAAK